MLTLACEPVGWQMHRWKSLRQVPRNPKSQFRGRPKLSSVAASHLPATDSLSPRF
ncbi:hypothetical protein CONLIGDRAFT_353105 [Coniochaeta ligniaria NRRL 30616]|uniref:Uncharacterized protein n=1 Tax=Coniochaeta ligniaria NRRL 30616 TaxID=1408157 RepID=A0A1J7IR55_9PEZI|nr:hypothetical protein CONLIGDRAFT_353105 [Coniochaeta ligniaria NRRL 30616]